MQRRLCSTVVATLVVASLVVLTACDPPAIGPGCQFHHAATSRNLNQNTADGGDGEVNYAADYGSDVWAQAGTDAPVIHSYWPAPPAAGKGDFEVRTFTSNVSSNSGYTSTVGPAGGFAAPTCGSSAWASKPHVWLNSTNIYHRRAIGQPFWNVSTAAHELGHALGLDDNHNDDCAAANLMEGSSAHAYADCNVWRPTAGDERAVNGLYD